MQKKVFWTKKPRDGLTNMTFMLYLSQFWEFKGSLYLRAVCFHNRQRAQTRLCVNSVEKMSTYLGDSREEPLTCSGGCRSWESFGCSVPSTVLSRSSSEVLLSPKSSKCSSSPPMTVSKAGLWLWSSEFRENLRDTWVNTFVIVWTNKTVQLEVMIWLKFSGSLRQVKLILPQQVL